MHHHGEPDHVAYVGRPFHEVRAAVRERSGEVVTVFLLELPEVAKDGVNWSRRR